MPGGNAEVIGANDKKRTPLSPDHSVFVKGRRTQEGNGAMRLEVSQEEGAREVE